MENHNYIYITSATCQNKMAKRLKVLHKSQSFILGYCSCPCNKKIEIRSKNRHLMRYKPYHHMKK